jgi:hypothetical protein
VTRDLTEASRRYAAAAAADARYDALEWPLFEGFLAALRALERKADQLAPTKPVQNLLTHLRFVRRILRSASLPANHDFLGLDSVLGLDSREIPESFAPEVDTCITAVGALLETPEHPALGFLAEQIFGLPDRSVNALVIRQAVDAVARLFAERGWNANVVDLTGAKRADLADVALILGSPEFHAHWNLGFSEAARSVAWLLNSPMGMTTQVVSWPGNFPFDPDNYVAWSGAPRREIPVRGATRFTVDIDRAGELARDNENPPELLDDSNSDTEPVPATPVRLVDGQWIYFSDEYGPSPYYVDFDDFEAVVREAKSLRQVEPGMVLLVRDGDASRSFLDEEARKWIIDHHDERRYTKSISLRDDFRRRMRDLARHPDATTRLRNAGVDDADAQRRLRLANDPTHIAPQKREDFERLCRAIGLACNDDTWADITLLRTAARQAGHTARRALEEAVRADDKWQALVEIGSMARITVPHAGTVALVPVREVVEEKKNVPISRLGQLETAGGAR